MLDSPTSWTRSKREAGSFSGSDRSPSLEPPATPELGGVSGSLYTFTICFKGFGSQQTRIHCLIEVVQPYP